MRKVFISYSSKDRSTVIKLKEALERQGNSQLWFDQDAIMAGGYYAKDIADAIRDIDVFLLVVSKHSVGNTNENIYGSDEVSNELALAKAAGALIIPVKLDGSWLETTTHSDFKYLMARTQWLDALWCQSDQDYDEVAAKIEEALTKGNFQFDYQVTLDEIDALLKNREFAKADARLRQNVFPDAADERVFLAQCIVTLAQKPIRDSSHVMVDGMVAKLKQVKDPTLQTVSIYLQAVLSQFFYSANALADITGGFDQLKARAAGFERIKAKYTLMIEALLPPQNGFALKWMRK